MSALKACLAAFAVAAWSNNEGGREAADKAVDDYLACFQQADQRSALEALKTAYLGLKLDSHVAVEIVEHIDQRIAHLPKRRSRRGGPENDQSPLA